jgi:hypothetical protein
MAPDEGGIMREQLKRVTTVLFMNCTVHQPSISDTFESDPYLRKLLLSLEQKKWCLVPDESTAATHRILESIGVNDCFENVIAFDEVQSITEIEPERNKILFLDFNIKRLTRATKLGFLTAYVGSATEDLSKVVNFRVETIYNMQENVAELWDYKCVKKQAATSLARKNGIFNTAKLNNLEAKSMITSSVIVSDSQLKPHAGAPSLAPIHHDDEAEMGGTSSEKNFSWNKQPQSKSCVKLEHLNTHADFMSPRDQFEKKSDEDFFHEESVKVMQSLQPGSKKNLLEPMGADKKPKKKHKKEHRKSKGDAKSLLPPLVDTDGSTSPTNMNRSSLETQDISAILKAARSFSPSHSDAVHLSPIPLKPFKAQQPPTMHPSSLFNETQFLPRTFQVA